MNRITSTITYGNDADYDKLDEWQRNAHPWTVELRFQRRRMTVHFWTVQAYGEPSTADVVNCLISDASAYDSCASFEDWCADLGFDEDSRRAERIWRAVERQTDKLKRLLGDAYDAYVFADEDEREHMVAA